MGSRFEIRRFQIWNLAVFQAFSGLVHMFSPAKKTSTQTHTSSLRKKPLTPKDETLFLDVLIFSIVFFMLALFEVCEDDVVSCLKGRPVCWRFLSTTKFGLVKFKPGRNLGTWRTPSKNCLSISLLKWELFEFCIPSFAPFWEFTDWEVTITFDWKGHNQTSQKGHNCRITSNVV